MARITAPPVQHPRPYPQDNEFLEVLFGIVCRDLPDLPGANFVARANFSITALNFLMALKPRSLSQWLAAADVTSKYFPQSAPK